MQITLTSEIENALTKQAQKAGKTPEQLALDLLHEQLAKLQLIQPTDQGTLADFLAGYIGVISSSEHRPGGAGLSEDTGKRFAALLTKRRQEGRL
jgi:hypothetical protein